MSDNPPPAPQGEEGGAAGGGAGAGALGTLRRSVSGIFQRGEILFALGMVAILAVLLLPMPPILLDFALAISITYSVLILMVALFIEKPLQFNAFPTVLLTATMLRLSLNLASTRLILSQGHEGPGAAGDVIEAAGSLLMSGNFLIGIIVFGILVIVNFVVITKGAGRIAEVTARFTLDAMPGKQMAIDADLSSGLIDEQEAKERREELQKESNFFGAMDGASKFVRGDAIAGLLITTINVIGGIIVGTWQMGLSFAEAGEVYLTLTVGDGLVTQIPALIVSTAAGMLITKSDEAGSQDKAVFRQLGGYPAAMGLVALLATALAVIPGFPFFPFMLMAVAAAGMAYYLMRQQRQKTAEAEAEGGAPAGGEAPAGGGGGGAGGGEAAPPPKEEEPISTALAMDTVRLELGYALLALINSEQGGQRLTDQIKGLRRQLAQEMGFVMPSVRIMDNLQLNANSYVVMIKEIEAARGDVRPNMLLVMDPKGEKIELPGEETTEPTFGLPAMWVDESVREEAMFKGYTVVDAPTVVTTHLTEIIKEHMPELLSYTETQKLLDELGKEHQKLVADVVPNQITVGGLSRVLQNLLRERVSIRDLPTILEGVSEACGFTRSIAQITEHVRGRLARQICDANTTEAGYIPLVTLSPEWEQEFAESIVGEADERQLSMSPSKLQDFITKVRQNFERFAMQGEAPVLLTNPAIRPYVRSIIERFRPSTVVMSQNEIHPRAKIKTLGQI